MPSDSPVQDTSAGAPGAPKVDFTSVLAKAKAIAAKLGSGASAAAPMGAAPPPSSSYAASSPSSLSAPPASTTKRPYEEDS
ncbi:hypothetical protein BGW38_008533, partial [Lunasporangiospora selenospora]